KYLQQVARLTERKYEVKDLVALLEHGNPRVRTLAAAALSARGDPKLLPHLVALANDRAETFPEPAPSAVPVDLVNPKKGPTRQKRTVGERVSLMVQEYLSPAGYHYGVGGAGGNPGFDDYWAKRKDRAYCASWFAVALNRASFATSPTPKERVGAI